MSLHTENSKKEAFLFFQSEILRSLNNNVANIIGGTSFPKSWREVLEYKPETRSAAQVKSYMLKKMREFNGEK